jgi:hypothetical protein
MMGWTAIRDVDGSLHVPFHVETTTGWHADGVTRLQPGDPGYDEHDAAAISAEEMSSNPAQDAALIARWEAADPFARLSA